MCKNLKKFNICAWEISFLSFPFLSLIYIFHSSPAACFPWSTVLTAGWSVTCGVYVSVCLTVYSELILKHSINLSYSRSNPTCPLDSECVSANARFTCWLHACPTHVLQHLWHPECILPPDLCTSVCPFLQIRASRSMQQYFMCSCPV